MAAPKPDTLLGVLQTNIRVQMNELADTICTGVATFEEYRRIQGVIEGLARAERILLDLNDTIEKAQEGNDVQEQNF